MPKRIYEASRWMKNVSGLSLVIAAREDLLFLNVQLNKKIEVAVKVLEDDFAADTVIDYGAREEKQEGS